MRISFCSQDSNNFLTFLRVLLFKKEATAREIHHKIFEYIIHLYKEKFKIPDEIDDISQVYSKIKKKLRKAEFF